MSTDEIETVDERNRNFIVWFVESKRHTDCNNSQGSEWSASISTRCNGIVVGNRLQGAFVVDSLS